MNRRLLIAVGGSGAALVLLAGVLILVTRDRPERDVVPERYTNREILLPEDEFVYPDIEAELLTPPIRSVVDPEQPLDPARAEALEMDTLQALHETIDERIEDEVAERLFE